MIANGDDHDEKDVALCFAQPEALAESPFD